MPTQPVWTDEPEHVVPLYGCGYLNAFANGCICEKCNMDGHWKKLVQTEGPCGMPAGLASMLIRHIFYIKCCLAHYTQEACRFTCWMNTVLLSHWASQWNAFNLMKESNTPFAYTVSALRPFLFTPSFYSGVLLRVQGLFNIFSWSVFDI